MTHKRNSSVRRRIVPRPGHLVKARIIGSGITLTRLAGEAGMARSTLSDYLAGRIANISGQLRIYAAWCILADRHIGPRAFWGGLLDHRENAA